MAATARRLLILSCSRRKRPDPGLLPALERYDGPRYRLLRKFRRERPDAATAVDVLVLSAELGLIAWHHHIPWYDRVMTAMRAAELRSQVLASLRRALDGGTPGYTSVFISAGRTYRQALAGSENVLPPHLVPTVSSGAPGQMLAQLRAWLYEREATDR